MFRPPMYHVHMLPDRQPGPASANGFTTASYILGPGGEQLTELSWSGGVPTPAHTNVYAAGQLAATYSNADPDDEPSGILYFHLNDWPPGSPATGLRRWGGLPGSPATGLRRWGGLGTSRVLTDAAGNAAEICHSLPFGNGEDCPTTPTEHLFTGKERDQESGNDYFGARYYASSMGRFMSPDVGSDYDALPYATLEGPQSLNLYSYVQNNPLTSVDADGRQVTVCTFVKNDDGSSGQTCNTISDDAYKAGVAAQKAADANNPPHAGYDAPGGDRPNGVITNDGQAVGTATWSPNPTPKGPDEGQAIPGDMGLSLIALRGPVGTAINMAQTLIGLGTQSSGSAGSSPMVGTKRSPMDIPRGTNQGTTIGGRYFTGHALDEMQSNGYVPSVVEDAIATGNKSPGNTPGTSVYTNGQARVVVNGRGDVITVMPQSR